MTREEKKETIEYLKKYRELDKQLYQTAPFTSIAHDALVKCLRHWDTAISALEQEPCDKCVYSTKDGYCQYDDITETIPPLEPREDTVSRGVFEQVMWERDIAIDQLKELGYELGQKIEPCDDAVSRAAVRQGMIKYGFTAPDMTVHEFVEDELPSVTVRQPEKCCETCKYNGVFSLECSRCDDDMTRYTSKQTARQIQKPLKCRNANCGAMCSPADAEIWSNDPKKCPNYKMRNMV